MSSDQPNTPAPVIGIVGWKNSGKTTLAVALIETLTQRGYRVASIKHAHHAFSVDDGETDSARHRRAGARQVAVTSGSRWALITEGDASVAPDLAAMIARLDPADIIIVEGFKGADIPKIEARRTASAGNAHLAETDPRVIAIAADHPVAASPQPVFELSDIAGIADFVEAATGLISKVEHR